MSNSETISGLFQLITPMSRVSDKLQSALFVTGNKSTELKIPDITLTDWPCFVLGHIVTSHPHVYYVHGYGSLNSHQTYYNTPSLTSAHFPSSPQLSKVRDRKWAGRVKQGGGSERETERKKKHSAFLLLSVPCVIKSKVKLVCAQPSPPYTQRTDSKSNHQTANSDTCAHTYIECLHTHFHIYIQILQAVWCSTDQAKNEIQSAKWAKTDDYLICACCESKKIIRKTTLEQE